MPVFEVWSRTAPAASGSRRRISHARQGWYSAARIGATLLVLGILTTEAIVHGYPIFLVLLPVCTGLVVAPTRLLSLLRGTLTYDVLTVGLALAYFGGITAWQLFLHDPDFGRLAITQATETSIIIVITTTLFATALLDPFQHQAQELIERRFNVRDREAARAVDAFTSTLREEIDLARVRDGLLDVLQRAMRPQSVALWVGRAGRDSSANSLATAEPDGMDRRTPDDDARGARQIGEDDDAKSVAPSEITVADDDPFGLYARSHVGAIVVERLNLASPTLQKLRASEVEIVLPLVSQGELIGLIALGPRRDGQDYAHQERALLATLAAQAAPALRVAQAVREQQEQVRERERAEQELRTAREIQHAFLPKEVPAVPGWRLVPYYLPAREVGGDFYDFLVLPDGRLGVAIGDVTGKGVPAALVMATVHTMLRGAVRETTSPGDVLARINDQLAAELPEGMFVTCFYAVLDPASGQLRYANAGHEPPFREKAGLAAELRATGRPLGIFPGIRYDEREDVLTPGEGLFLYSDGVVEARNTAREMFGFPRLATLLAERADGAPLGTVVLREIRSFAGAGWEQEDDVTLITVERLREAPAVPGFPQHLALPSVAGNERQAMAWVERVVAPLGFPPARLADLRAAVAEAVMNAMEHGNRYRPDKLVSLEVVASPTAVTVRVRDEGAHRPIPSSDELAEPDLAAKLAGSESPRGWGLFLMRRLVDEVTITGDDAHHVVELILHRGSPDGRASEGPPSASKESSAEEHDAAS